MRWSSDAEVLPPASQAPNRPLLGRGQKVSAARRWRARLATSVAGARLGADRQAHLAECARVPGHVPPPAPSWRDVRVCTPSRPAVGCGKLDQAGRNPARSCAPGGATIRWAAARDFSPWPAVLAAASTLARRTIGEARVQQEGSARSPYGLLTCSRSVSPDAATHRGGSPVATPTFRPPACCPAARGGRMRRRPAGDACEARGRSTRALCWGHASLRRGAAPAAATRARDHYVLELFAFVASGHFCALRRGAGAGGWTGRAQLVERSLRPAAVAGYCSRSGLAPTRCARRR